jgi:hypothetical protein
LVTNYKKQQRINQKGLKYILLGIQMGDSSGFDVEKGLSSDGKKGDHVLV